MRYMYCFAKRLSAKIESAFPLVPVNHGIMALAYHCKRPIIGDHIFSHLHGNQIYGLSRMLPITGSPIHNWPSIFNCELFITKAHVGFL